MKKFVILLLAACLLLGGAIVFITAKNAPKNEGEPVVLTDPENLAEAETEAPAVRTLDYAALRALHAPDEIAGTVDGREVTWEEYFYWLREVGSEAEDYIQMLALYGQSLDWNDKLSADSESTLAEYVVELAQGSAVQLSAVEALAEECGATLSAENEQELAEQLQQAIASSGAANEDEFNAMLEEQFVSRAMYDRLNRANYLYQNSFTALYGEDGEKIPAEEALDYLRENSYLCASHILFATMDLTSYEKLDDATIEQKKQQAEAVAEELRSIEDAVDRAARFAELKEELCEDSGKASFPDGYVFKPGEMVAEFENGVKELEDYEVSEPILSDYGYHVIMRLPLSADMTMNYSSAGTAMNARAVLANEKFNALLEERFAALFKPNAGFEIDLTQFLK